MSTDPSPLKFPGGNSGEALKGLLVLLKGAGLPTLPQAEPRPDQLSAELAYKLGQASGKAKDPERLRIGLVALLDALETINIALSGERKA